jgi:hypothetical protein
MADVTGLPQEEVNAAVREAFPQPEPVKRVVEPYVCPRCGARWKDDNSYGWSWFECGTSNDDWGWNYRCSGG